MQVEDELIALTSLIGSMMVGFGQARAVDGALEEFTQAAEMTEELITSVARAEGFRVALLATSGALGAHPQSRMLQGLRSSLEAQLGQLEQDITNHPDGVDPDRLDRVLSRLRQRLAPVERGVLAALRGVGARRPPSSRPPSS